jgi:RNA polymerase sigma-70 factor (ECF subfamily)
MVTAPQAARAAEARPAPALLSASELYREHRGFVWRSLRHLGVGDADLDDAIQEVFLVAHRKLHTFDGTSAPRTWLFGIARMTAMGMRKRVSRRREDLVAAPLDERTEASDAVERRQELEIAHRAIDSMPEDQRLVFVLFEIEEMPMAEVARSLDCALKTAYGRLYRARETFRAAMEAERG